MEDFEQCPSVTLLDGVTDWTTACETHCGSSALDVVRSAIVTEVTFHPSCRQTIFMHYIAI